MSLDSILLNNRRIIQIGKSKLLTLDRLKIICKELIGMARELDLENQDVKDFISNLKQAKDYKEGKKLQCENRNVPSKIVAKNTRTGKIVSFSLNDEDHTQSEYLCMDCSKKVAHYEVKVHVKEHN